MGKGRERRKLSGKIQFSKDNRGESASLNYVTTAHPEQKALHLDRQRTAALLLSPYIYIYIYISICLLYVHSPYTKCSYISHHLHTGPNLGDFLIHGDLPLGSMAGY